MQWYSPEEQAILDLVTAGDFCSAQILLDVLEPRLTVARRALMRGKVSQYERPNRWDERSRYYSEGIRAADGEPATLTMLLVEASVVGYVTNDTAFMRELWMRANNLHMKYPGNEAVEFWYGTILLNFGNMRVRRGEFQRALSVLDFAFAHMMRFPGQPWNKTRLHILRAWCMCRLNRVQEAEQEAESACELDQNDCHRADLLLTFSRIASAKGQYSNAEVLALEANWVASAKRTPDWQTVVESSYQRLLIRLATEASDWYDVAKETKILAHRHGFGYMHYLVSQALTQQRKEVCK